MVTVWSIRNRASPQELQSQELGGRKAGLERGRESLHGPSIWGHCSLMPPHPPQPRPDGLRLDPGHPWDALLLSPRSQKMARFPEGLELCRPCTCLTLTPTGRVDVYPRGPEGGLPHLKGKSLVMLYTMVPVSATSSSITD